MKGKIGSLTKMNHSLSGALGMRCPRSASFAPIEPEHFPWLDYRRYTYSLGLMYGGTAVLSGHVASEFDPAVGRVTVKGDTSQQAATSWKKIGGILKEAGLAFCNIRHINVYIPSDRVHEFRNARDYFPPHTIGASVNVIPVTQLLRTTAHLEIEVVAWREVSDGTPRASCPFVELTTVPPVRVHCKNPDDLERTSITAWGRLGEALDAVSSEWSQIVQLRFTLVGYGELCHMHGTPPKGVLVAPAMLSVPGTSDGFRGIRLDAVVSSAAVMPKGKEDNLTAVLAGALLFVTGSSTHDGLNQTVRQTYQEILRYVCKQGGQLLKTVEFVDARYLPDYRDTAQVRRELFSGPMPAATGVVCDRVSASGLPIWIDSISHVPT